MDRYIREGRVAVLYSPTFGSGWSTWNPEYPDMIFDPGMAQLIEQGRMDAAMTYAQLKWPDACLEGVDTLSIRWLLLDTKFRISEHDGNEDVEILEEIKWLVA